MKTEDFFSFITKTKQTTFSFGWAGTKQLKTEEFFSFNTKTKQMAFSLGLAGTKQRKTNGILPISYTKGIQHFHSPSHNHTNLQSLKLKTPYSHLH